MRGTEIETVAKPLVAIKPANEHKQQRSVLVDGVGGMTRFCSSRTTSVVVVVVLLLLLAVVVLAAVVVVLAVAVVQCSTDRVFSPSTDD